MTVAANDTVERVVINGVGSYAFSFRIFTESDLVVRAIAPDTGFPTLLVLSSNYTVSGVNNEAGGGVTLTNQTAVDFDGYILDIRSDVQTIQPARFKYLSQYNPITLEQALDRAARQNQDQRRLINASIRAPDYENTDMVLPRAALRAGMGLMFDEEGSLALGAPTSTSLTASVLVSLLSGSPAQFALLMQLINPRTDGEIGASVTPTNYLYPAGTMLRYGADPTGVTDSTAAIQACINAAAATGHSRIRVGQCGATLKVNGNLTWPVDQVGIDFEGAELDCRGLTSGYTFNATASEADSTTRVSMVKAHPLENFSAFGPSTQSLPRATTGFLKVTDGGSGLGVAGVTVRNGGSLNFHTHYLNSAGAFFTAFENWDFAVVQDGAADGYSDYFIDIPVAAVSGERNSFTNCRFGIAASSTGSKILRQANGNADTHFNNCSFNAIGTAGRLFTISAGTVRWNGVHLEGSGDTDYWVYVSGDSTMFDYDGIEMVVNDAKTAYSPFYCHSDVVGGGIQAGSLRFVCASDFSVPLIAGEGPVVARGALMAYVGGSVPYYLANSQNILADPGFTADSFGVDGWVAGGTAAPTLVDTPLPAGAANVIRFTLASSQTNTLTLTKACKPGQVLSGQLYLRADSLTGSGGNFNIGVAYLDVIGNALETYNVTYPSGITTNQAYTLLPINPGAGGYVRAPKGTAQMHIQMTMTGTTVTGSPLVYVGLPVLNLV